MGSFFLICKGAETYVKKIKSMKVTDIALAVNPNAEFEIIGVRPGEKLHEQMISVEDSPFTYEYDNYFKILPTLNSWNKDSKRIKNGKLVEEDFIYSSNLNKEWMSINELREWIKTQKRNLFYK